MGALGLAFVVLAVFTCNGSETTVGVCATPTAQSDAGSVLAQVQSQAKFALLYPCLLPAGQTLASGSVTGTPGKQQAEMVFSGPFDLTIRQSQVPPAVNPDPVGASKTVINLFPSIQATFIQVNDGSSKALYHLFWQQGVIFFELQAVGPPLQQTQILQVARSLQ